MSYMKVIFNVTSQVPASIGGIGEVVVAELNGKKGLLYITHSNHVDEMLAIQATWIVSCYLPKKWAHKCPFGGRSSNTTVERLTIKDRSDLFIVQCYYSLKGEYIDICAVPMYSIVQSEEYQQFVSEIFGVYEQVKAWGTYSKHGIMFAIANHLPEKWQHFKSYVVYTLRKQEYINAGRDFSYGVICIEIDELE
ncbi:hypothetical protein H6G33_09655 [Calothrix sp. FACHB-1219]|uniref:hypothetical protein n=1 Tax=unclassified Calothrix TaxID=2619626 RepID=UPI0016872B96|nr:MULTISPECIES: hypothetical protein [unclassified Calothrix]MBD2201612.1 hypothetical protein [Calothrix sp. FACHB-168]MBD2217298.1 hypothetical protein [Calothrix sp. FACHB-1219]